tara:strand:- start:1627 stop:2715 length:1089 start_codon:yes stop_codon:yes gene_type:complete
VKITEINKLYSPWVGGVESHVQSVSEGLNASNELEVICCNTEKKTVVETINNVKVTRYKSWGRLFSLPISFSFIFSFHKHSADILHFHLPNPLAVMAYLLNPPKGKVVITWHSDIIKQKIILFFYTPFLKLFLKKADRIITTSPNLAVNSKFLSKFQQKIAIVPLALDPSKYPPTPLANPLPKFALFVGRFIYYKGVLELIEAVKQTDITLVMIGEGPLEATIRKNGTELINEGRLKIYPFQNRTKLNAFFNACEFFILPSIHPSEAFGIVQLEAMVYEKALISTNLPTGVPWVNKDNETGVVVEPGNIQMLSDAISKLWHHPNLRTQYGKNAHTRFMTYFTEDKLIEKTNKLFKKLSNPHD